MLTRRRMHVNGLCLLLFLFLMPGEASIIAQIRVGPFLQNATPTSIWVVWETETGEESKVEFGETEALGNTSVGDAIRSYGSAWIHRAELTGLEPDSRFYYRVITGFHQSEVLHFRTPPLSETEKPFQFVVYSDTQSDHSNPDKHKEVIDDGIIAYTLQEYSENINDGLAFVINAGDLVENGTVYSQWKNDFFDEAQRLFQHVPLYPVLGNHEQDSDFYTKYFHLPPNGSPGFMEHWYYFDYSNVRIIGLDSNSGYRNQTQLDWLDQTLAEAKALTHIDFVFAVFHHPFKSELWLPGELNYSGSIVQRLETFTNESGKPSGHFFGHTHGYSRGQSRDSKHLWVNAASGEGNIDYWGEFPNRDYPEFQFSSPDWGFVVVEVAAGDDPKVTLRRISRGNEVQAEDNLQTDWISVRVKNNPPDTPTAVFPIVDEVPVAPEDLVFQASPFNDVDGDALLESELQVTASAGNYSNPIIEEWLRVENWYSPPGASGRSNGWYSVNTVAEPDVTKIRLDSNFRLTGGTYFWRIRYRDDALAWSDWSAEAGFTTEATNFTDNLLVNPGAEQGIAGWTIIDPPLEATANGDCGTNFDPAAGSFFFT
ncbi:metallophosphoesterase family protein, partial [bacterium]|nr:metallophosphoesterase family protein [bacterium]